MGSTERPSLIGAWAKVERAREHGHSLVEIAEAFIERRPNQLRFDKKSEPGWVRMFVVVEPVPIRVALIAGDVVHNLRSALDHLAWQLVTLEGQKAPGTHTAFPIYTCKTEFEERVRNPSKGRVSPLHGIDPAGYNWARIERAQPYHATVPYIEPLAVISELDNADKHRTLLAGISLVEPFDARTLTQRSGVEVSEFRNSIKVESVLAHDAEIARFRPISTGTVEMKSDLPFQVAISDTDNPDEGVAAPLRLFDRLRSEVVGILRSFEPVFP